MKQFKTSNKHRKRRAIRRDLQVSKRVIALLDKHLNYSRSCQGCTACCHVMGVRELKKTFFTDCQHQCQGGCGIYRKHPPSCQGFLCGWRCGLPGNRPDIQGILFDRTPQGIHVIYEVWPNASESPENKALIDSFARKCGDVLFLNYGERNRPRWWFAGHHEHVEFGKDTILCPPENVNRRVPLNVLMVVPA